MVGSPSLGFAGTKEALEHYDSAKRAYSDGDFRLAADLLERAYAEDPDLIYQYNRVRALQALGEYDEAIRIVNIYKGPMLRDEDGRFNDVEEIERQLRKKVEEENPTTPPVEDDPIDPPDEVEPDSTDPVSETNPETPVVTGEKKSNALGWTLTGVGGLLLTSGIVVSTGLFAPTDDAGREFGEDGYSGDLGTQKIASIALVAAGAATLIPGILLLTSGGDEEEEIELSLKRPRITPYIGPDGAGATLQLRF